MTPEPASLEASAHADLHHVLRAATRDAHRTLDHMMLQVDLGRPADYGWFLKLHVAALGDLRGDWREEDVGDFSLMLGCLESDLAALGEAAPDVVATPRAPMNADAALGLAYVVRGSRLGAAVLRKRVPDSCAAS
jgi:heme oxygenase